MIGSHLKAGGEAVHDIVDGNDFPLTDSGNAEFFERQADFKLAHDHTDKMWYKFEGHHWRPDSLQRVVERAVEAMRQRGRDALLVKDPAAQKAARTWALKSEDRKRINDLLALAQSKPSIAVTADTWDSNQMLLGVKNGVVDLETNQFRHGYAGDYVLKASPTAFDTDAICPTFEGFMDSLFPDTPEMVPYLQRALGYCLTGLTNAQIFWILVGGGSNGKSTLMELLAETIFGAYSWLMPFPTATWTATAEQYQLAELSGRRLVNASEVTERGHLNESFIKGLTGSDTINARRPYGRPFTFKPVAKFWLRCNDRPVIKDTSHSMWRRVKLIEFTQTFPVDTTLRARLDAEASGILNWLLEGTRLYRTEGLCEPACVQASTANYREASDVLAEFLEARCQVMTGTSTGGSELFAAYQSWEANRGTQPDKRLTQRTFGTRIKAKFTDVGTSRKTIYSGLMLINEASR